MDDTQPHRQRYLCHGCRKRFDDLTGTILAGHHQPLRSWVICLYFMGLNLSTLQIARELDIHRGDAQAMVQLLRQGVVDRRPAVTLEGALSQKGWTSPDSFSGGPNDNRRATVS